MTMFQKPPNEHVSLSTLRAEDEEQLDLFFITPYEFSRVLNEGSVIVFGEPGSGKTALYRIMQNQARGTNPVPENLLVFWRPAPIPSDVKDNASAVKRLALQVLDACGITLLTNIAERPQDFDAAPDWVKERLVWFIKKSIRGNLSTRVGPLMDTASDSGRSVLEQIHNMVVEEIIFDPSPDQMIAELLTGLKRIGLGRIWVMSDGLEGWADADPDQLTHNLVSFLSSLSLFEHSGMVFKFFIPSHMEPAVIRASGVLRRRVDAYHLNWDANLLQKLVEKRLAVILNKKIFTLQDLCESPDLMDWLNRVGGGVPREWLDQIQPLVKYYAEHQLTRPVKEEDWKELRSEHPPYFWMEENAHEVKVGGRVIPLNDVPPKAYDMLRYLYQHSGQVVSKEELYYLVYLEMSSIPRSSGDAGYESPNIYAGLVDTSIYRLRQAIEPNPAEPILLRTVRGHGITLVSRL